GNRDGHIGFQGSVLRAADDDPQLLFRNVNRVVVADEDTARASELLPGIDVIAILIEDLDAIVSSVADEDSAPRVHGDAMRVLQSTGGGSELPPRLDERPVLRELHDSRRLHRDVAVGDEDVAVRRDHDVGWLVERVRTVAGDSSLAKSQQKLAVGAVLVDQVALSVLAVAIGRPDIA